MQKIEFNEFSQRQRELVRDILSPKTTKRKRVLGGAGSGKTTVIAYCAQQLLREGKEVWVCYFNNSLLVQIKKMIGVPVGGDRLLTVQNYHKFMTDYLPVGERDLLLPMEGNDNSDGYRFKPTNAKPLFDYIFLDEMQDIIPNAILNLLDLLRDGGKLCVFADKYQKLYDNNRYEKEDENLQSRVPKMPKNAGFRGAWTRLTEIYRADNLIQHEAVNYAKQYLTNSYGTETFVFKGENKESVLIYATRFSYAQIADYLAKLPKTEQNSVAVLFHFLYDVENFADELKRRHITYTTVLSKAEKQNFDVDFPGVKVSTVKSFKGLEIPTCIYVAKVHQYVTPEADYVALSRATAKLIICNANDENKKLAAI